MPTFRAPHSGQLSSNTCRSAGGLILVLALVTGLLNFPTICHCGAELPHPHSLFVLADHHHSPDGEIEITRHDDAVQPDGGNLPYTQAAGPGPFVQSAGDEGTFGDQIGFAVGNVSLSAGPGGITFAIWQLKFPIPVIGEPPEPPPPRA